jgi:DNA-binding LytR/AlgR family response regulator
LHLNAIIVEDEPHSLSRLLFLLKEIDDLSLAGTAENGEAAIRMIDELKPDLVFLDIQLPGMTGFDVLTRSRHRPAVIFVTAFDQYAVKAFEENAIDYLLKPTSKERLQKAVARVMQTRRPPDQELLEGISQLLARNRTGRVFSVKHQDEILLIPEKDVFYFKAEDKYIFLCTAERSFFYESTLKELEATLDPDLFLRVHKSYIVALARIKKLQKYFLGDYILELDDAAKTHLRVGRSYLPALKDKLKF